jgi:hypothetical protein
MHNICERGQIYQYIKVLHIFTVVNRYHIHWGFQERSCGLWGLVGKIYEQGRGNPQGSIQFLQRYFRFALPICPFTKAL